MAPPSASLGVGTQGGHLLLAGPLTGHPLALLDMGWPIMYSEGHAHQEMRAVLRQQGQVRHTFTRLV